LSTRSYYSLSYRRFKAVTPRILQAARSSGLLWNVINSPQHEEPKNDTARITHEKPHGPFTVKVECEYKVSRRRCKAIRYVKPQDAFQVRYCRNHTEVVRKERRSERAKERREAKATEPKRVEARAKKAKAPKAKIAPNYKRVSDGPKGKHGAKVEVVPMDAAPLKNHKTRANLATNLDALQAVGR
jgi:hypothetical protein